MKISSLFYRLESVFNLSVITIISNTKNKLRNANANAYVVPVSSLTQYS